MDLQNVVVKTGVYRSSWWIGEGKKREKDGLYDVICKLELPRYISFIIIRREMQVRIIA